MASASLEAVARPVATARAGGRMSQNGAQIRDRGGQGTLKQWSPTSSRSNSRPPICPPPEADRATRSSVGLRVGPGKNLLDRGK